MSKHNPLAGRRAFLKTVGATLALPATAAIARLCGADESVFSANTIPPRRLCAIFFGNGVALPPPQHPAHKKWHWFPHETGPGFALTAPLEPLSGLREHFSILSGLSHPIMRSVYAHATSGGFLTGADPQSPRGNTISMDQVYARHASSATRFPSLVMSSGGGIGKVARPLTMSFTQTGQPIPAFGAPTAVFDELFGVDKRGRAEQQRAFGNERSMLDAVVGDLAAIEKRLGGEDKARLEEYLTAVRGIETRIDRAEAWLDVVKPKVAPDAFHLDADPIADGPTAFLDTMYQLIHTAFLTDSTRVATFQKAREGAGPISGHFPKTLGFGANHHQLSHRFNSSPDGWERWSRYDQYLTARLATFLASLAATDDPYAEGSLLDNTIVLYGAGTSTTHNTRNYPILVAGGRNMGLVHGSHHRFDESIPFSNLLLTILQSLGTPQEQFADSTGTIDVLSA